MNLNTQKAQLRELLKQRRAQLDEKTRSSHDQKIRSRLFALPMTGQADAFFCFISFGDETDTHDLINVLLAQGKSIAVPKLVPGKGMLAVPFSSWHELKAGELGILTPESSTPADFEIGVCLTPGLGFSPNGGRLGYGRGYYDRWFSNNPVHYRIALAYECQICPEIPVDDSDVPVDIIITEERVRYTTGSIEEQAKAKV
jgi:5-formyltetrahydrofolate cyclo-ligase